MAVGSWYLKFGANPHLVRPKSVLNRSGGFDLLMYLLLNTTRAGRTKAPRTTSSLPHNLHPPHPPVRPRSVLRRSRSVIIRSRRCGSLGLPPDCHHVPPLACMRAQLLPLTHIHPHPTPVRTRTRALARDQTRAERGRSRAHTHIAARAVNSPVRRLRSAR